jgi:hypothetical protein
LPRAACLSSIYAAIRPVCAIWMMAAISTSGCSWVRETLIASRTARLAACSARDMFADQVQFHSVLNFCQPIRTITCRVLQLLFTPLDSIWIWSVWIRRPSLFRRHDFCRLRFSSWLREEGSCLWIQFMTH